MDVEQQADALFSKVRTLPIAPTRVGSRRPPRSRRSRAPAPAFSERTLNTSRRVARLLTTPLFFPLAFHLFPPGPARTLSARTFETLLTRPTSERTRCAPSRDRSAPIPPARRGTPHPTRVFHNLSVGTPRRVAAAAPGVSESPTRGTFFPPSEKTDPLLLPSRSFPRPGMDRRFRTFPRSRATCPRWTSWTTTPRRSLSLSRRPRPAPPSPPRRMTSPAGPAADGNTSIRTRSPTTTRSDARDGPREGGRGTSVRHA